MSFYTQHLQELFHRHIPSIVENPEAYSDRVALDLGLRVVDELIVTHGQLLIRHGTYSLALESLFSETEYKCIKRRDCSLELLLRLFLAAEVEERLVSTLSFEQQRKLADVFAELGQAFLRRGWYEHAQHCCSMGAHYYGQLRLFNLEDRCWYQQRKSAMRASSLLERAAQAPLYVFSGFGFKPYRLVWSVLLINILFSIFYFVIEPSWSWLDSILVSSFTYLAAFGYSDLGGTTSATQLLVTFQSFLALVLNATLFALLVKKWFR